MACETTKRLTTTVRFATTRRARAGMENERIERETVTGE